MALYSEKVMDHFRNPRNVGVIENPDGVGEVGNPVCGDIMKMYLKIEDGIIKDVKFKTFGCGAAVATSSMATELVKSVMDACHITDYEVVGEPVSGAEFELMRYQHVYLPKEGWVILGDHVTLESGSGCVRPRRR